MGSPTPHTLLIEHVTTRTTTLVCEQRSFQRSVFRVAISEPISVADIMDPLLGPVQITRREYHSKRSVKM